jgi:hypothetical protein
MELNRERIAFVWIFRFYEKISGMVYWGNLCTEIDKKSGKKTLLFDLSVSNDLQLKYSS